MTTDRRTPSPPRPVAPRPPRPESSRPPRPTSTSHHPNQQELR